MGFHLLPPEIDDHFQRGGSLKAETRTRKNRVQISGYRYYSPRLGRWINRDPIEERGSNNLNIFSVNNPVVFIDSLGLYYILPIPNPRTSPFLPSPPWPKKDYIERPNVQSWLGFNLCIFNPPSKNEMIQKEEGFWTCELKDRPPIEPVGGMGRFFGKETNGLVGSSGAGPCVILVIKCKKGTAVFHFQVLDDPERTLGQFVWDKSCKVIVCGGDSSRHSRCLKKHVLMVMKSSEIHLVGSHPGHGCGFLEDGGWYGVH